MCCVLLGRWQNWIVYSAILYVTVWVCADRVHIFQCCRKLFLFSRTPQTPPAPLFCCCSPRESLGHKHNVCIWYRGCCFSSMGSYRERINKLVFIIFVCTCVVCTNESTLVDATTQKAFNGSLTCVLLNRY